LLHLLDLYRLDNLFQDYIDIRKELEAFSPELGAKEEIIVLSKSDLLDDEMKEHILGEFKAKYPELKVFMISSATRDGIEPLQDYLVDNIKSLADEIEDDAVIAEIQSQAPTIYNLKDDVDPRNVEVVYL
jgi:GTP-binding protein